MYIQHPEIVKMLLDFIKTKIFTFLQSLSSKDEIDQALEGLQIISGTSKYDMKIEYLPQLFLQRYCKLKRDQHYKEFLFFEDEHNEDKILRVEFRDSSKAKEIDTILKPFEESFIEWLNGLIIFYEVNFQEDEKIHNTVCKAIGLLIESLINADTILNPPERDRGSMTSTEKQQKATQRPVYPMPTETFYVR